MTYREQNLNVQLGVLCNTTDAKVVKITYDESIPIPTQHTPASALKEAIRICKPEYTNAIPTFRLIESDTI